MTEVSTKEPNSFLRQGFLIVRLALRLAVLVAWSWPLSVLMVLRLVLFAIAISPAIVSSVVYWWRDVAINERYGPGIRHLVDVYRAKGDSGKAAPVVVFLTGGAWIIGYKAWGVPLGRALSAQGFLVLAPDYRNCPQTRCDGMLEDVDRAVGWCLANAARLGGDPERVLLVGQSAGAHLCALLLLRKAEKVCASSVEPPPPLPPPRVALDWRVSQEWRATELRGFVGVSGPYHVEATAAHWIARGFDRRLFDWIFGGQGGMARNSPTDECARLLRSPVTATRGAVGAALPNVCLIHGTADQSAPCVSSELLEARLRLLGANVEPTRLYRDWSHSDPILERPFAGDQTLHRDVYDLLRGWSNKDAPPFPPFDDARAGCQRLAPQLLLDLASWCMPF